MVLPLLCRVMACYRACYDVYVIVDFPYILIPWAIGIYVETQKIKLCWREALI